METKTKHPLFSKKQLDEIAVTFKERFRVVYILNKTGSDQPDENKGIMNLEKNTYLLDKWIDLSSDNEYFICGPTGMMDSAVAALKEKKVDASRIHVEYFSAPVVEKEVVNEITLVESEATIICDGDEITVKLKPGENCFWKQRWLQVWMLHMLAKVARVAPVVLS
jgi:ring-1,2-phenylacetyl-CoA epoxidase subunit PaaE